MLGPAELLGDIAPGQVRALARGPEGYAVAMPVGQHAAWLHRHPGDQMVVDRPFDDDVGLSEPGLEVASAQRPLVAAICAELGVGKRAVVAHRGLDSHDWVEWLVLDDHGFCRVLGGVAVRGDHHRDRRPDTRDAVPGKRPPLGDENLGARGLPGTRRGLGESVEVLAGEDGADTRLLEGRRGVDRYEAGVGFARADERRVELALDRYVVEEAAAAAKQPCVLGPADRCSDVLHLAVISNLVLLRRERGGVVGRKLNPTGQ